MNPRTRDNLSVTPRKFDRFGDSHYLRIDSAEALRQVLALPEARWFASNAPVEAFRADQRFLSYLNENRDGRLRPQEIKAAIRWTLSVFGRISDEAVGSRVLEFRHIKDDGAEGREVLQAGKRVLKLLGKPQQKSIDLKHVDQLREQVEADGLGRPGFVGLNVECSERCHRLIEDIAETVGQDPKYVTEDDLEEFRRQCRALEDWEKELEEADQEEWLPFGDETEDHYLIYADLYDSIEAFFSLCQLSKVSPQVKAMLSGPEPVVTDAHLGDLEEIRTLAERQPIAAVNSDGVLKLNGPLNPREMARLEAFRDEVFAGFFGDASPSMKRAQWEEIKARFSSFDAWFRRRPDVQVTDVDPERRRNPLVLNAACEELLRLLAESRENAVQLEGIRLVEKAILYQAHLLAFANNFVSCPDLYSPAGRAMFEMGTMILDGREFTFCVRVPDRAQHIRRCLGENIFVIYAAVSDCDGKVEYEIAAPVTSGLRGHLHEGQWGVFHDSLGREFNAQVTKLLESPISLWEGLAAPFRRLMRAAVQRMDSLSMEAESGLRERLVEQQLGDEPKPKGDGEESFSGRFLASGGLALAALGAAGGYMARTLADTDLSDLFWASVGMLCALLLPLTLLTAWRLWNRDLRCLLEGANWGINLRMRLTPTLARAFTRQRRI